MNKNKWDMNKTAMWSNIGVASMINSIIIRQFDIQEENYVLEIQSIIFDKYYDIFDDDSFAKITLPELNAIIAYTINTFIDKRK